MVNLTYVYPIVINTLCGGGVFTRGVTSHIADETSQIGGKCFQWVRNVLQGGGAKRFTLGQFFTATGAKRLKDGCGTSWGGGGGGQNVNGAKSFGAL